jgi:hypothetical protein
VTYVTTGSFLASTWESSSTVNFGPAFEEFVCSDATTPYPNGVSSVSSLPSESRIRSRSRIRGGSRSGRGGRAAEDVAASSSSSLVVSESVFAPIRDFFAAIVVKR